MKRTATAEVSALSVETCGLRERRWVQLDDSAEGGAVEVNFLDAGKIRQTPLPITMALRFALTRSSLLKWARSSPNCRSVIEASYRSGNTTCGRS